MVRRVIAVDIDPGMLALARTKVTAVGATNCDLIEADAYAVAELAVIMPGEAITKGDAKRHRIAVVDRRGRSD